MSAQQQPRIEVAAPDAYRFYKPEALPGCTLTPREQEFLSSYAIGYVNSLDSAGKPVVEPSIPQRMVEHGLAPERLKVEFDFGNGRRGGLLFRRL